MKRSLYLFLASALLLSFQAQAAVYPPPPPDVIQAELDQAESDFYEARKMFNPWYSGPLLTGSAHTLDPGLFLLQPYLYVIDNYRKYNNQRDAISIPDLVQVNPQIFFQTGIVKGLDIALGLQGLWQRQMGISSGGIGDTSLTLGIQLIDEGPYVPALKIGLSESFPSGKYRNLDPSKNGLDGVGAGSYETTISLNFGKVVWWILTHPMAIRFSLNYKLPSKVHVNSFNSYGGGFGTDGTVRPAKVFTGDIGIEYSFTQRWVFATDIVYNYFGRTRFSGTPGITAAGTPASNVNSFGDQLSLAPAIEYNPSGSMGILGGVWFTVYGRNAFDFISGVISYYQVF